MMSNVPAPAPDGGAQNAALFAEVVDRLRDGLPLVEAIEQVLASLTSDEVLWLLDGDQDFWSGMAEMGRRYNETPVVMGAIERIGLPGLRFSDGPRGVVMGSSTAFPVSMARGATWDVDLEERIGRAIGAEMRAQGGNFFGGVCINLPRHPAWGRAQETYGEDSHLLGELGAALVRGVQRHGMAVAKHYALNSMENARFSVDVTADEAALREVYLPHFRRVVEAGVFGIMTAYNRVNGEWAAESEYLLEDVLRADWGFDGVTISDFVFGLRHPVESVRAGLDVESPFRQQRAHVLPQAVESGDLAWEDVTRAARRVIGVQLRFAVAELDPEPSADVVFSDEHRLLARQAAATSIVLLKNEVVEGAPVLPVRTTEVTSIAVIGRLSDLANTGDLGSSAVRTPEVVTALSGIRNAFPGAAIVHVDADDPAAAAAAAADADLALVVVGYTAADEGEFVGDSMMSSPGLLAVFPPLPEGVPLPEPQEAGPDSMGVESGGDRASVRIRPIDSDIIRAVAAVNARTVVSVVTAGAVIIEDWKDEPAAILFSWYSGSEGGNALADVLTGAVDVAGRLPYSIPTDEAHLPWFDKDATEIVYDRWHGQRLLDREGWAAGYPLGFGLSYTSFDFERIELEAAGEETLNARVTVRNTGDRAGRHVIQLYGVTGARDFPTRVLIGFAPVELQPGESKTVTVEGSTRPLQRWAEGRFQPAARELVIEAASFSGDPEAATSRWSL